MYEKILVPLDGSGFAEMALRHARAIAECFGSEVIMVRVVVSPFALVSPDMVLAGSEEQLQAMRTQAELYLKGRKGEVCQEGIKCRAMVLEGPVARTIVDFAESEGVDLIVMSTHGRSGLDRWVFGSVAEKVIRAASCPVFLVPSKK
jgi:nucleotide-binding universal stress UspA family protein